ncbi:DNA-deoxyinosine glycosylase [Achromobacter deleyi]|uniref:DNA-deoxyinosine glycosylase n=1 Tax=Achromobacter deleyi TaxID=1353891 RepID=UPI001F296563|nr:DNA-deoxyinosine glycosylase [Achromobacter deleyi]UIP19095.1 DNA-deoxyinosine glycosylase [Achromobacter deleyi]
MDSAGSRRDEQVWGFAPVAAPGARVLVLGSMPGVASLRQARYYAHPRNAFWPLAGRIFGFDPGLDYPGRLQALQACGVALWDVLQACERPGSLDADIRGDTLVPNDFRAFLSVHPGIARVCFNGAKAAALYRRHVLPGLDGISLQYFELPSTSPAHAAASFDQKLAAWEPALKV